MLLLLGCVWFAVANAQTITFDVVPGTYQYDITVDGTTYSGNPPITLCGTYTVTSSSSHPVVFSNTGVTVYDSPTDVTFDPANGPTTYYCQYHGQMTNTIDVVCGGGGGGGGGCADANSFPAPNNAPPTTEDAQCCEAFSSSCQTHVLDIPEAIPCQEITFEGNPVCVAPAPGGGGCADANSFPAPNNAPPTTEGGCCEAFNNNCQNYVLDIPEAIPCQEITFEGNPVCVAPAGGGGCADANSFPAPNNAPPTTQEGQCCEAFSSSCETHVLDIPEAIPCQEITFEGNPVCVAPGGGGGGGGGGGDPCTSLPNVDCCNANYDTNPSYSGGPPCFWDGATCAVQFSTPPGFDFQEHCYECSDFNSQSDCTSKPCDWTGSVCLTPLGCSSITDADQCNATGCRYTGDACKKPCSHQNTDYSCAEYADGCTLSGSICIEECKVYTTEERCVNHTNSDCNWDDSRSYKCQRCSEIDSNDCENHDGCISMWGYDDDHNWRNLCLQLTHDVCIATSSSHTCTEKCGYQWYYDGIDYICRVPLTHNCDSLTSQFCTVQNDPDHCGLEGSTCKVCDELDSYWCEQGQNECTYDGQCSDIDCTCDGDVSTWTTNARYTCAKEDNDCNICFADDCFRLPNGDACRISVTLGEILDSFQCIGGTRTDCNTEQWSCVCAPGYSAHHASPGHQCIADSCVKSSDPTKDGSDGLLYCTQGVIGGTTGSCTCSCYSTWMGDGCNTYLKSGCMDADACNYDPAANTQEGATCYSPNDIPCGKCDGTTPYTDDQDGDGICDDDEVQACINSQACNYDATFGRDQGSNCIFKQDPCDTCSGETDGTGVVVTNDEDGDGVCDANEQEGCVDSAACNYNSQQGLDSKPSMCIYPTGCETCATVTGCYGQYGQNCGEHPITDGTGYIVDNDQDDDGICDDDEILGCQNTTNCNYQPNATDHLESKCISPTNACDKCTGCMDPTACNYNPNAIVEHTACIYPPDAYCNLNGGHLPSLYDASYFEYDRDDDDVCDNDEVTGCDRAEYEYSTYSSRIPQVNHDGIEYFTYTYTTPKTLPYCNYDSEATDLSDYTIIYTDAHNYSTHTEVDRTRYLYLYRNELLPNPGVGLCTSPLEDGIAWDGNTRIFIDTCQNCSGETDGTGVVVTHDADGDGVCDYDEIPGCQNAEGCNYNPHATDPQPCVAPTQICERCNSSLFTEYIDGHHNPDVGRDNYGGDRWFVSTPDGSIQVPIPDGVDYNEFHVVLDDKDGDGVCDYDEIPGCQNYTERTCNYDPLATDPLPCVISTGCDRCFVPGGNITAGYAMDGDSDNDGICAVNEIFGCQNTSACNYKDTATDDCEYWFGDYRGFYIPQYNAQLINGQWQTEPKCAICTFKDDICETCSGEQDGTGVIVDNDLDDDGVCNADEIVGCQNATGCNYNPNATDPGLCIFATDVYCGVCEEQIAVTKDIDGDYVCDGDEVVGCQDVQGCNYNIHATDPDTCLYKDGICDTCSGAQNGTGYIVDNDQDDDTVCDADEIVGCQDDSACNYMATATDPDECAYKRQTALSDCDECTGQTDGTGTVIDNDADDDDICDADEIVGCQNVTACNYKVTATDPDTCAFPSACDSCSGDTDGTGYIIDNDEDNDGVCDEDEVEGCQDNLACNYMVLATDDPIYPVVCLYKIHTCDSCSGEIDGTGTVVDNDQDNDNHCDQNEIVGCQDVEGCNYNIHATDPTPAQNANLCLYKDGICDTCSGAQNGTGYIVDNDQDDDEWCDANEIVGCQSVTACNFMEAATDRGNCVEPKGCQTCSGEQDGTGTPVDNDQDNDDICDADEQCTLGVCKHGTCTDLIKTFSCDCDDGWQGNTCEDKTPCEVNAEGNACVNGIATGFQINENCECACDPPYGGATCEVDRTGFQKHISFNTGLGNQYFLYVQGVLKQPPYVVCQGHYGISRNNAGYDLNFGGTIVTHIHEYFVELQPGETIQYFSTEDTTMIGEIQVQQCDSATETVSLVPAYAGIGGAVAFIGLLAVVLACASTKPTTGF